MGMINIEYLPFKILTTKFFKSRFIISFLINNLTESFDSILVNFDSISPRLNGREIVKYNENKHF